MEGVKKLHGRTLMEFSAPHSLRIEQNLSADLIKLIRKFRWIGLEEEARQLEIAVSKFPPETRSCLRS